MNFDKLFSFIRRDFNIATSYKLDYFFGLLNSLFPIFLLFFIAKLLGPNNISLTKYGGDFFSFVVVGLIFTNYLLTLQAVFSSTIGDAQQTGCLEAILSSQTNEILVILYSSVYSLIYSSIILLITLFVSTSLGLSWGEINYSSFFLVFFLSLLMFFNAGLLTAAFTIVYKKGNIIGFLFGGFASFLGGAFFPIALFPKWMQVLSKFFPITYCFESFRLSLLKGYTISMLSHEILVLGILSLALFPISFIVLRWAIHKGRRDGTLMHY